MTSHTGTCGSLYCFHYCTAGTAAWQYSAGSHGEILLNPTPATKSSALPARWFILPSYVLSITHEFARLQTVSIPFLDLALSLSTFPTCFFLFAHQGAFVLEFRPEVATLHISPSLFGLMQPAAITYGHSTWRKIV
jgi:hypothetical protein